MLISVATVNSQDFCRLFSMFLKEACSLWNWFLGGSLSWTNIVSGLCMFPWLEFALRDYDPSAVFDRAIRMTYYSKTLEGYTDIPLLSASFSAWVSTFVGIRAWLRNRIPWYLFHPFPLPDPQWAAASKVVVTWLRCVLVQLVWKGCKKKQTDPISRIKRIERIWIFLGEEREQEEQRQVL